MIFEQIATGGCQSYLVGCPRTLSGALIDPEISQIDRYKALASSHGLHIRYVIDTHTHADHFSAAKQLSQMLGAPTVMHQSSPAPHAGLRLDDDDMLIVGDLRIRALHTPGHTADSMCLVVGDRVFTGDTLLIGGTGRTDLPTGDPDQLYDSLFGKLLTLDQALLVFPAHDYKGRSHSSLGVEIAETPGSRSANEANSPACCENSVSPRRPT
jgi:glyoxylase-like metal-dependent hydrolase (beta-lactamase superfamily II)